ncbi:alpha/beta hydrolase family protein [Murinocardiopsis flavida]|uniref:Alpha/beta hydrolase family protein n=1 Tax=Murinocardiopsis flavida TaxID=645275 RepID=A0A2P8DJM3_9ACTN|nr:alpha/beta fold hydrolase [Murinocardiopsis flavida]PSK97401.1 alpha/beta hydrolase family protein [Murinocardiopsis flavida]
MRSSVITTSAVVAMTAVVGLSGGANAEQEGPPKGKLAWGECAREDIVKGVECGTLTVPLDWSEPDADTVPLRVFRYKAPGGKSRGTIVNFPSGPGESGDIAFAGLREKLPGYDLVAIDPRGVGESSALNCSAEDAVNIPLVPPTDGKSFTALEKEQRDFWSSCTTKPTALKQHTDAYSNARDAEALRTALGLDRINLHGFSYGTLYAERYLAMFGQHVNGSILEGVMNPAQSRREFITTAATGSQALFDRFAKSCAADAECALHGQDIAAVLRTAKDKADAGRIPGDAYGRPWSAAAVNQYLDVAMASDVRKAATGLLKLSRGKNPIADGNPGGQPEEPTPDRVPYSDPLVCSDFDMSVESVNAARRDQAAMRTAAPDMGYSANSTQYTSICLGGPQPAKDSAAPVTSRSDNPTLLLSNSHDPATPIAWADSVERQLGPDTDHIRTDKTGHGGAMDEPEVNQRVTDYLNRLNP